MGPYAGIEGGEVVAAGTLTEIMKSSSVTAQYLENPCLIPVPETRRKGNGHFLSIQGARGHNLHNIDINMPLGTMICVTGMSGSGKSTLIKHTLYPILSSRFYHSTLTPLAFDRILGIEHIDKVIEVDQSPIGRTPRSNPLTYTNIFNDIRKFFEELPDSKIRGYNAGRFSFNVKGGRCETCRGSGLLTIEMNFLPDVFVTCPECNSRRYNSETLQVKYKGKSIYDVLEMTFNQGVEFFSNIPAICKKLAVVKEVGLGYLKLGQPSTTLSGGEAQRIKIATELMKKDTGKTFYILDEPTTGLHFHDIRILLGIVNKLIDRGNTVLIIEHNLDVIKNADYIIDLGPEGGTKGGYIMAEGTPEEVAVNNKSLTGKYLLPELDICITENNLT
jgi:excinuclease ABC subunit A